MSESEPDVITTTLSEHSSLICGSNARHFAYKANALTTELRRQKKHISHSDVLVIRETIVGMYPGVYFALILDRSPVGERIKQYILTPFITIWII